MTNYLVIQIFYKENDYNFSQAVKKIARVRDGFWEKNGNFIF